MAARIRREREPSHLARRPPDRAGRTSPWIRSQWIPPPRRPKPGSPGPSRPPLLSEPRTATSAWRRLAGVPPPGPQLAAGRRGCAREGETTPRPLPTGTLQCAGEARPRRRQHSSLVLVRSGAAVAGEFGEFAVARGFGGGPCGWPWASVSLPIPNRLVGAGSVASASSSCCGPRCQSQPPGLT